MSEKSLASDKRARLSPYLLSTLGDNVCGNILQPIIRTNGLIFPYTPQVSYGANVNYNNFHFTHSNYQYYQYQNSSPADITITADFTAQTNEEGRYLIAALRFLRFATMLEFGEKAAAINKAGLPPPVLRFNYLGAHMFNNVPVIVNNFNAELPNNVDYVKVQLPSEVKDINSISDFVQSSVNNGKVTYVPTKVSMMVTLFVQQNPTNVRKNFDLTAFKQGKLINRGFI